MGSGKVKIIQHLDSFNSCSVVFSSSAVMSAVYTKNISGLSMDLCSTPEVVFDQFPMWVLTNFLYEWWHFKKLVKTTSRLLLIPVLYNLYISASLQTDSKAPSKSVMIVIALFIFSASGKIVWKVLLFWYVCRFLFLKKLVCSSMLVASCRTIV